MYLVIMQQSGAVWAWLRRRVNCVKIRVSRPRHTRQLSVVITIIIVSVLQSHVTQCVVLKSRCWASPGQPAAAAAAVVVVVVVVWWGLCSGICYPDQSVSAAPVTQWHHHHSINQKTKLVSRRWWWNRCCDVRLEHRRWLQRCRVRWS